MNKKAVSNLFNFTRFDTLRSEKGISKLYIAQKIDRTAGVIQMWKNGKSAPNEEQLRIVADILGTTPEYLSGESDEKSPPSPEAGGGQAETLTGEEARFIRAARRMRPEQRAILLELLEAATRNTSPEAEQIPARLSVVLPADAGTRTATGNSHP